MLAVDTNILVRLVTDDDPPAAQRARQLLSDGEIFIGVTVVLECAWVLLRRYRMPPATVVEALRSLAGLPNVVLEAPEQVHRAFTWVTEGVEFPDALHLALSAPRCAFATFDRKLLRQARTRDVAVVEP